MIGCTCFPGTSSLDIRSYPDSSGLLPIGDNGELSQIQQMLWPGFCVCVSPSLSLFPLTTGTFLQAIAPGSGHSFPSTYFLPVSLALAPPLLVTLQGLDFFCLFPDQGSDARRFSLLTVLLLYVYIVALNKYLLNE